VDDVFHLYFCITCCVSFIPFSDSCSAIFFAVPGTRYRGRIRTTTIIACTWYNSFIYDVETGRGHHLVCDFTHTRTRTHNFFFLFVVVVQPSYVTQNSHRRVFVTVNFIIIAVIVTFITIAVTVVVVVVVVVVIAGVLF
jgi:hypothetical protein